MPTKVLAATSGRVQILSALGSGGMGDVYLAYDKQLQQQVALKVLRRRHADSLLLFKREFRALAEVAHHNLVCLYDFVVSDSICFFTMEYVAGRSLLDTLCRTDFGSATTKMDDRMAVGSPTDDHPTTNLDLQADDDPTTDLGQQSDDSPTTDLGAVSDKDLDERRGVGGTSGDKAGANRPQAMRRCPQTRFDSLLDVAKQLAVAISALHRNGHLHRDIKPSNVMVDPDGRVVVLDFGIVSGLGGTGQGHRHNTMGTPPYMAPELFDPLGKPSAASDWYAFGMVLYRLLTGELPYRGDFASIANSKIRRDPPPVLSWRAEVPTNMATLIDCLLKRNPRDRPTETGIHQQLGLSLSQTEVAAEISSVLLGRCRELAALREIGITQGATAMVYGYSGMGKTALVEHFVAQQQADGVLVLAGRCYERESVPLKAFDGVMDAAYRFIRQCTEQQRQALLPADMAALVAAFPVFAELHGVDARHEQEAATSEWQRRAIASTEELLRKIAQHRRLIVYIDDLQWSDIDSVPFLTRLIRDASIPMLLLYTFRQEERDSSVALAALRASFGGEHELRQALTTVEISPLPEETLVSLAGHLLGERSVEELASRIGKEARGSPYLVHELVNYVRDRNLQHTDIRLSLEAVVAERVQRLSAGAQHLLGVVCLAGWKLPRDIAESACTIDFERRKALVELSSGHFVRTAGEQQKTVEPYHDKIREVVFLNMTVLERSTGHLALATAIEQLPQATQRYLYPLAQHYAQCRSPEHGARAFEVLVLAARRSSSSFAYEQSRSLYTQAAAIAKENSAVSTDGNFLLGWADASARAGRVDEAEPLLARALAAASSANQRSRILYATSCLRMGQLDASGARSAAEGALQALGGSAPRWGILSILVRLPALRRRLRFVFSDDFSASLGGQETEVTAAQIQFELLSQLGYVCYFDMDTVGMVLSQIEASSYAARLGPSAELVIWLSFASMLSAILGKEQWSVAASERAAVIVERLQNPAATARQLAFRSITENFLGKVQESERLAIANLRTRGELLLHQDYLTVLADLTWGLLMRGYARESWQWTQRGLRRLAAAGNSPSAQGHTFRCYAGPALTMLGRAQEGQEYLDRFAKMLEARGANRWQQAQQLAHRLWAMALAGDHGARFDETVLLWRQLKHKPGRVPRQIRHVYVAIAYVSVARLQALSPQQRSRSMLRRARADLTLLRKAANHPSLNAHLYLLQARLSRLSGKINAAQSSLSDARQMAEQHDNPWVLHLVWQEAASLARLQADAEGCAQYQEKSRFLVEQHGWNNFLAAKGST